MAEIVLKSPHFKQRDLDTVVLIAQVTIDCASSTIDIPGLTLANAGSADACGAVITLTLSGFEAESDVSLDDSREPGIRFLNYGTASGGVTLIEVAALTHVLSACSIIGCAGSRTVEFDFGIGVAGAFVASTDILTDAVVEIVLPIKSKDF